MDPIYFFIINILSCCIFVVLGIYALSVVRRNLQQQKLNSMITNELNVLLNAATNSIGAENSFGGLDNDINSPEILTTIITVMISKYGDIRLQEQDFKNVATDEYVSVYVDRKTEEIILSLDHSMATDSPHLIFNYSDIDDNTYH